MPSQATEREYRRLHDNLLAEVAVARVVAVGGSLHCEACKQRDTIHLGLTLRLAGLRSQGSNMVTGNYISSQTSQADDLNPMLPLKVF